MDLIHYFFKKDTVINLYKFPKKKKNFLNEEFMCNSTELSVNALFKKILWQ